MDGAEHQKDRTLDEDALTGIPPRIPCPATRAVAGVRTMRLTDPYYYHSGQTAVGSQPRSGNRRLLYDIKMTARDFPNRDEAQLSARYVRGVEFVGSKMDAPTKMQIRLILGEDGGGLKRLKPPSNCFHWVTTPAMA